MESEPGLVKAEPRPGLLPALLAAGRVLLDQLYPPVCLACGRAVGAPDGLCGPCWAQLAPITAPMCPVLGLPFETDLGPGAVSPKALADPPPFARARAALAYNDLARRLVSLLKYADRPEMALFCARIMAGAGGALLKPDAVLVPVPLHRTRQIQRRYNQSTELARVLAGLANIPFDTDLVVRRKRTARQVGLNARQRARNVEGAFRVRPDARVVLAGRRVVIVDDVLTTGATVSALARAFRAQGVENVDVLTFARVVFETDMTL